MTDDWNRRDTGDNDRNGGGRWWRRGRRNDGGRRRGGDDQTQPAPEQPGDQQQQRGGQAWDQDRRGPWQGGRQGQQQPTTTTAPPASTAPATGTTTAPATGTAARGRTAGYNEGNPGTCVFYALDRFHQVTGVYPYAFGDALLLADGAAASGWTVSTTPRTGTVAIFQPGQNGATAPTGHAAWVEQVTTAGQIYVSEWNAPTPFVVTRRWLTPDRGVRYIYT